MSSSGSEDDDVERAKQRPVEKPQGGVPDISASVARIAAMAAQPPDLSHIYKAAFQPFDYTAAVARMIEATRPPDLSHIYKAAVQPLDYTAAIARMIEATRPPDLSHIYKAAVQPIDYTAAIARMIEATRPPDLSEALAQVVSWSATARLPRAALGKMIQATAMSVLVGSVPEAVSRDPEWRRAANEWVSTHALALILWPAFCVVTLLFCVTTAIDYDLVDKVNTALATPAVLLGIGLAVWGTKKQK